MTEKELPGKQTAETNAYLYDLFEVVKSGGPNASAALGELSLLALGGHPKAGEMVGEIDQAVEAGDLSLPKDTKPTASGLTRVTQTIREFFASLCHAGEVPQDAWSQTDQKCLQEGKKPLFYPKHPNV